MSENLKLQQQYEGSRLAVAAYAAKDIKVLLATNPSQHELSAGLHSALVTQGFSVDQANSFVAKYTPNAALDQDGAGAVLFKVNGTNQIATAIRGTNPSTDGLSGQLLGIEGADGLADGTIALGELPVYQATLIANFVLRETTPAGQPVPQFSVQGGNSNAADLARATADSLANAGGEKGNAPNLVTMPVIVQTGTVMGTGNAVGPCVDAAAHSEGSPEITTLGSAIAQCSRITTVNGPGVSVEQMQSVSDQIATQAGRPQQDIASQSQLNVHTSGVSVIDGLNGGLPGDQTLLNIPGNSHSSIVAMNAAEAQYKASLGEGVMDLGEIEITAPRETNTSDEQPNSSSSQSDSQIEDAFNNADQTAADIKAQYPNTEQVADASGDLSNVDTTPSDTGLTLEGAAAGIGLFNAISNVQNWEHLSDLGKLSALAGLHNALAGVGTDLPGDFGGAASWLSLAQGIESGNVSMTVAGLNSVSDQAIDGAINSAVGSSGVPYVGVAMALSSFEDNPAQSMGTLVGMYFAGPLGGMVGGFIGGSLGGLFGDDDIPMREGLAHAQWDASGHTQVVTSQDAEGGGATANSWMSSLVGGLQAGLDQHTDAEGKPQYGLVPNRLPSVGFKYDPDGFNLGNGAQGFVYLQWTDETGQAQTRYYDGAGNRGDGSGETLSGEIDLLEQTHSLPTELADGLHQTLQVASLQAANDDYIRCAA